MTCETKYGPLFGSNLFGSNLFFKSSNKYLTEHGAEYKAE